MRCVYCKKNYQRNLSLVDLFCLSQLRQTTLCQSCLRLFKLNNVQSTCVGCSKFCEQEFCLDCKMWQRVYPKRVFHHESIFHYGDGMQEWFQAYKFKGDYELARSFSGELATFLKSKKDWLIIPIPISKKRLLSRGFNQVEALLDGASISYQSLLIKKDGDLAQSSKSKEERLLTNQPFILKKKAYKAVENRKVLIVDDVYTTGRTIFHARDCIEKAAPKIVETFSLAR